MRPTRLRHALPAATAGLLALAGPAAAQDAPRVRADVELTRVGADAWRLDYAFDSPVSGIALGPPVAAYREQAWSVVTPGVALVTRDGGEALVAADSARTRFSVVVRRYTEYAPDRYVPLVPFTDGGAALYLGYFAGGAIRGGEEEPADFRFRFVGRPSERVLPPGGPGADAYVYFGPQEPVATDHARLVVDPGAPAWLRDALLRAAESATRVFAGRLGGDLPSAPLVLVGAGELDRAEGSSVKGGAVGGQLVMLLRGRGLRDETERKRAMLERLTAHELAHLWQLHALPAAFSVEEPWLHEGAAEAMAVHALGASGLWSPSEVTAFAEQTAERCRTSLAGATLPEAKRQGNWDAVYACGFGLYWSAGADPLPVWSRLVEAVRREGHPYTQATLDRVLAAPLPATGPVSAQEPPTAPAGPPSRAKSVSRARLISVAHTAAATSAGLALLSRGVESDLYGVPGYWLTVYGTVVAPSAGSYYARDSRRTKTGLAIRTAGGWLVLAAAWRQLLTEFDLDDPDAGHFRWDALSLAGAGVMTAGAAYSVATIPASVEEHNRRLADRSATPRVSLSPAYTPAAGTVGVHVDVRF